MKKVLIFAAVAEAATGLALLIVPSLVGQLLLGEELTGVAIPVARVAGIALIGLGIACWPGPPLVGMLTYSAAVTLYLAYLGFAGGLTGVIAVAGGRSSPGPHGTLDAGRSKRRRSKNEEENAVGGSGRTSVREPDRISGTGPDHFHSDWQVLVGAPSPPPIDRGACHFPIADPPAGCMTGDCLPGIVRSLKCCFS